MRKEKKFFKIASLCFTLIAAIIIFFLMAMTYATLKNGTETLLAVREDWTGAPYVDFKIGRADYSIPSEFQKCPAGYSLAFIQPWKGTQPGCNCSSIRNEEVYYEGLCSYNRTLSGCKDIAPIAAKKMTILDDYIVCGKKFQGEEFYLLPRPNEQGKCQDSFRVCGHASDRNFQFCVENNLECPINNLTVEFKNGALKLT